MGLSGELDVEATGSEPRRCSEDSKREVMEEVDEDEEVDDERAGGRLGDMVGLGVDAHSGDVPGRQGRVRSGLTVSRD